MESTPGTSVISTLPDYRKDEGFLVIPALISGVAYYPSGAVAVIISVSSSNSNLCLDELGLESCHLLVLATVVLKTAMKSDHFLVCVIR